VSLSILTSQRWCTCGEQITVSRRDRWWIRLGVFQHLGDDHAFQQLVSLVWHCWTRLALQGVCGPRHHAVNPGYGMSYGARAELSGQACIFSLPIPINVEHAAEPLSRVR